MTPILDSISALVALHLRISDRWELSSGSLSKWSSLDKKSLFSPSEPFPTLPSVNDGSTKKSGSIKVATNMSAEDTISASDEHGCSSDLSSFESGFVSMSQVRGIDWGVEIWLNS
jgi:hypothetical protein